VNREIVEHFVNKVLDVIQAINRNTFGSVVIYGIGFKPGSDDTRESPGLEILRSLYSRKVHVNYYDSQIPRIDFEISGKQVSIDSWSESQLLKECPDLIVNTYEPKDIQHLLKIAPELRILNTRGPSHNIKFS